MTMLEIQEQPSTYFQKEMSAMTSYIVFPVQVSVHLTFFPMTSQTEIPSNTFMSRPKVKIQTSRQPVCNAQWISQPKWHLDSIKKQKPTFIRTLRYVSELLICLIKLRSPTTEVLPGHHTAWNDSEQGMLIQGGIRYPQHCTKKKMELFVQNTNSTFIHTSL